MAMTREQEQELEDAIDESVNEARTEPDTVKPFPQQRPASLTAQWDTLARYDRELRSRVRQERIEIVLEYNRLVTETENDFARREDHMLAELHAKRDTALKLLRDKAAERLHEHDLLSQRMG
jgi:hypothetical protein